MKLHGGRFVSRQARWETCPARARERHRHARELRRGNPAHVLLESLKQFGIASASVADNFRLLARICSDLAPPIRSMRKHALRVFYFDA